MREHLSRDTRLLVAGQALRGLGYGFTAIVLGDLLAARGVRPVQAGLFLAAVIAGSALASLIVGAYADRFGRRRSYGLFFGGIAVVGAVVATNPPLWLLFAVALTGTLSTDVVDNGAATTLEQVMLAREDAGTARVYGWYNAAGAAFGALGALGATLVRVQPSTAHAHAWLFVALVPIGILGTYIAGKLSPSVEAPPDDSHRETRRHRRSHPGPSRHVVRNLTALFSVDAAGGGLVTAGFLSYYLVERYEVSLASLGWLLFAVSALQAVSVLLAPLLARRVGLVATMVGTHLPSNLLLASTAFAPSFTVAAILLLIRATLSQMDVPTRQALVMTVTTPPERTHAAAVTNAARYSVRPIAPLAGGALQLLGLGVPLLVAGIVKSGYDVALWRWAQRLPGLRPRGESNDEGPAPGIQGGSQ
ncbi:MAG: MFS transporter [Acidobacteriota bacterium]|nr:MFS transporter [Acidobacteriota bacterium]